MAKQTAIISPENAQDSLNELLNIGESKNGVTFDQAFEILESSDQSKMVELTSQYFNFDSKGKYNFVFEGMDKANIDGKQIEVVRLRNKEGQQLINGNAVLVNSLRKVTVLPCYVRVEYTEDVKSAAGTYKNLKVYVLPQAVS